MSVLGLESRWLQISRQKSCVLVLALVGVGVGTVMGSPISLVFVCTVMATSLVLVER